MQLQPVTAGWLCALVAFLLSLVMIFLPAIVPFNHITGGVDGLLLAASRLLP